MLVLNCRKANTERTDHSGDTMPDLTDDELSEMRWLDYMDRTADLTARERERLNELAKRYHEQQAREKLGERK